MFKIIKRWIQDYNDVRMYMAEHGIMIFHTPFGVICHVDDNVIKKCFENERS